MSAAGRIGSWRVVPCRAADPLPQRALVVEEEDRYRVLSAPPMVPDTLEHPLRVMTAVWDFEPSALGTVVVAHPRRWLAIVHDLDAAPSLDPGVATETLRAVFDRAEADGFECVALRLWGVTHGPWSLESSLDVLMPVLAERWRPGLRELRLRGSAEVVEGVRRRLAERHALES
jgi:hypothetical protein